MSTSMEDLILQQEADIVTNNAFFFYEESAIYPNYKVSLDGGETFLPSAPDGQVFERVEEIDGVWYDKVPVDPNQFYPAGSIQILQIIPASNLTNLFVIDLNVSQSIFVDTIAPDTPENIVVDNVRNDSDELVTQISGQAEPFSNVSVFDADNNLLGSVKTDDEGNFSLTTDQLLAVGTQYTVTSTDRATNTSTPASITGVAVDDGLEIDLGDGNGFLNCSHIDCDDNTTVKISISDTTAAQVGDLLIVNGQTYVLTQADIDAKEVSLIIQAPNEGEVLEVTAVIQDSNTNQTLASMVTSALRDTIAPDDAVITEDANTSVVIQVAADAVVASLSYIDSNGQEQQLELFRDEANNWTGTNLPALLSIDQNTLTLDKEALQHNSVVSIKLEDQAGNPSDTAEYAIDSLALAPALSILRDTGDDTDDALTYDNRILVSGIEEGAQWFYSLDGGNGWVTGQGNLITLTQDGSYNIIVRQIDRLGNVSPVSESLEVSIDTQAPELLTVNTVYVGQPITGTAEAGVVVTVYLDDGRTFSTQADSVTGEWVIQPIAGLTQSNQVLARAADAAGNESAWVQAPIDQFATVEATGMTRVTANANGIISRGGLIAHENGDDNFIIVSTSNGYRVLNVDSDGQGGFTTQLVADYEFGQVVDGRMLIGSNSAYDREFQLVEINGTLKFVDVTQSSINVFDVSTNTGELTLVSSTIFEDSVNPKGVSVVETADGGYTIVWGTYTAGGTFTVHYDADNQLVARPVEINNGRQWAGSLVTVDDGQGGEVNLHISSAYGSRSMNVTRINDDGTTTTLSNQTFTSAQLDLYSGTFFSANFESTDGSTTSYLYAVRASALNVFSVEADGSVSFVNTITGLEQVTRNTSSGDVYYDEGGRAIATVGGTTLLLNAQGGAEILTTVNDAINTTYSEGDQVLIDGKLVFVQTDNGSLKVHDLGVTLTSPDAASAVLDIDANAELLGDVIEASVAQATQTTTSSGLNKKGLVTWQDESGDNFVIATTTTGYRVFEVESNNGTFTTSTLGNYNFGSVYNGSMLTGVNSTYDREMQLVQVGDSLKFVDVTNSSINVFDLDPATGALTLKVSMPYTSTNPRGVSVVETDDGGYTLVWGAYSGSPGIHTIAFDADDNALASPERINTTGQWAGTVVSVDDGQGGETHFHIGTRYGANVFNVVQVNGDGSVDNLANQSFTSRQLTSTGQTLFSARVPQETGADKTFLYSVGSGRLHVFEVSNDGSISFVNNVTGLTQLTAATSSADVFVTEDGLVLATVGGSTLLLNADGSAEQLSVTAGINGSYQEGDQLLLDGQLIHVRNNTNQLELVDLGMTIDYAPDEPEVNVINQYIEGVLIGTEITGSGKAGNSIEISDAEGNLVEYVVIGADGQFSVTVEPALQNGAEYKLRAVEGNYQASEYVTILGDTQAPEINDGSNSVRFDDFNGLIDLSEKENVTIEGELEAGATLLALHITDERGAQIEIPLTSVETTETGYRVTGLDLSDLHSGVVEVEAHIVDNMGNTGVLVNSINLDLVSMAVMLTDASKTGNPDLNFTNIDTPAVEGYTGSPNIEVNITYVDKDGVERKQTVTSNAEGYFTTDLEHALSEGDNTLAFSAELPGSFCSCSRKELVVRLDTEAPDPVRLELVNDTGFEDDDRLTNDPEFTHVEGTLESGATIEYWVNDTWTSEPPTAEEGANTVIARQVDAAGNPSEPSTFDFVLDTIAPDLSITTVALNAIQGTAEPGNKFTYTLPDGTTDTVTVGAGGTWSIPIPNGFQLGPDDAIAFQAEDAAGNISELSYVNNEIGALVDADPVGNRGRQGVVGRYVGITAQAEDQDPWDTVTYTLLNNNNLFAIDPTTGMVRNIRLFPVRGGTYSLKIQAESSDGTITEGTFTVFVPAAPPPPTIAPVQHKDPLVLDLTGEGVNTLSQVEGVRFDLYGNGTTVDTGWVGSGSGFLVRDINGNGTIDDGSELFGNATRLNNGDIAGDGFEALSDLDSNADGVISSDDELWAELKVWQDFNADGKTDEGELLTLDEVGVASLSLSFSEDGRDSNGNAFWFASTWADQEGNDNELIDVTFHYQEWAPNVSLLRDTGGLGDDNTTSDHRVFVTNVEEGAQWFYSLDGGDTWIEGDNAVIEMSEDGLYDIVVKQIDAQGNESTVSEMLDFVLDTKAAELMSIDTVYAGMPIKGIAEAGSHITVALDDGREFTTMADMVTGAWSLEAIEGLTQANQVYVRASDAAGNQSGWVQAPMDQFGTTDATGVTRLTEDASGVVRNGGLVAHENGEDNFVIVATSNGYRVLTISSDDNGNPVTSTLADYTYGEAYNGEMLAGSNSSYDREFQLVEIHGSLKFFDVTQSSINVFDVDRATGELTLLTSTPYNESRNPKGLSVVETADGGYTAVWGSYTDQGILSLSYDANNDLVGDPQKTGTGRQWAGTLVTVEDAQGQEVNLHISSAYGSRAMTVTRINDDGSTTTLANQTFTSAQLDLYSQSFFSANFESNDGATTSYLYSVRASGLNVFAVEADGSVNFVNNITGLGLVTRNTPSADVYYDEAGRALATVGGTTLLLNAEGGAEILSVVNDGINTTYSEGDQILLDGKLVFVQTDNGRINVHDLGVTLSPENDEMQTLDTSTQAYLGDVMEVSAAEATQTETSSGLNKKGLVTWQDESGANFVVATTNTGYRVFEVESNNGSITTNTLGNYNFGSVYNGAMLTGVNSTYDREMQLVRVGDSIKFVDVTNNSINVFDLDPATGALTLKVSMPYTSTNPRGVSVVETDEGGYSLVWGTYSGSVGLHAITFDANDNAISSPERINTSSQWAGTVVSVDDGQGGENHFHIGTRYGANVFNVVQVNGDGSVANLANQSFTSTQLTSTAYTLFSARVPQEEGSDKTFLYSVGSGRLHVYEVSNDGNISFVNNVTGLQQVTAATSNADVFTTDSGQVIATVGGSTLLLNADGSAEQLTVTSGINSSYQEGGHLLIDGELLQVINDSGHLDFVDLGLDVRYAPDAPVVEVQNNYIEGIFVGIDINGAGRPGNLVEIRDQEDSVVDVVIVNEEGQFSVQVDAESEEAAQFKLRVIQDDQASDFVSVEAEQLMSELFEELDSATEDGLDESSTSEAFEGDLSELVDSTDETGDIVLPQTDEEDNTEVTESDDSVASSSESSDTGTQSETLSWEEILLGLSQNTITE